MIDENIIQTNANPGNGGSPLHVFFSELLLDQLDQEALWIKRGLTMEEFLRAGFKTNDKPNYEKLLKLSTQFSQEVLVEAGVWVRVINNELNAAAVAAQNCLGIIWAQGEPTPEAIVKARAWGQSLHARMLACAGDDLVRLGQLRQLLGTLFGEGSSAYAVGTSIGNRLEQCGKVVVVADVCL